MVEGAIDAAGIDGALEEIAAELRSRLHDDGVADDVISIGAALDCRYLGQGYELRVPLPEGRFTAEALAQFHGMHRQEYGHAFPDPIEVVNLRVTATGVRPKVERLSVGEGDIDGALIGEGETVFRVDGALTTLRTRHFDRASLPVDEELAGPAIVFQRDTTVLVPPEWRCCAQRSGNLILAR